MRRLRAISRRSHSNQITRWHTIGLARRCSARATSTRARRGVGAPYPSTRALRGLGARSVNSCDPLAGSTQALTCYHRALELDPELPGAHAGLAIIGKRVRTTAEIDRLRMLLASPDRPAAVRIDAGFALGMLLDKADRCEEAFPCFAVSSLRLLARFLTAQRCGNRSMV